MTIGEWKVVLPLLPLFKRKDLGTAIAKDGVVQVHELFLMGRLRFTGRI